MDKMQQILAEKLISEVVFYGKLGKLTEDSFISIGRQILPRTMNYQQSSSGQSKFNKIDNILAVKPNEKLGILTKLLAESHIGNRIK